MNKLELTKVITNVKTEELNELYDWVKVFSYSRPVKNLHRAFSDGVLMAELINNCLPKFVELHNYSKANSINQKKYNWNTLNEKVFKRLGFKLDKQNIEEVVNCKYMGIEKILYTFRQQLTKFESNNKEEEITNIYTEEKENTQEKNKEDANKENIHEENIYKEQSYLENWDFYLSNDEGIIKILKDKIQNLEKLLKIKDNKIDILNRRIDAMNRMKEWF